MKNKRLIFAYIIVFSVLLGSFIYDKTAHPKETTTAQMKTVGVLQYVSHPALDDIYRGFKDGLKKAGYTEGKNIQIDFQNGQADQSKLATMSQQLIRKEPDVLLGIATPAAQALANTTTTIPVVLGAVTDPVGAGLVSSMAHPSGNVTGVSDQPPVQAQIDLAKSLLPQAKTMGILYSSAEDNSKTQVEQAEAAAKKSGMTAKRFAVPSSNELAQTVQVMSQSVDFIYIPLDNTIANAMQTVVDTANKNQVPVIPAVATMVEQGGLATIGINQYQLGLRSGEMAAAILSGKQTPKELPVYTFKSGQVTINKKQADRLGITIPESILQQSEHQASEGEKK